MRLAHAVLLLGACASQPGDNDIVGPFTGPTHRYVVDRIDLPTTNTLARQAADDLDGNGIEDNQLGMVLATLASQGDITPHGADMIAAGVIASSVEIVADDLATDPTVSVLYRGADGEPAVAMGGRFDGGVFVSNRTATTAAPGKTILHFPAFVDADPAVVPLDNVEIDLVPDGSGGFDGVLRGTVTFDDAVAATYAGVTQMFAADPQNHLWFLSALDESQDWRVTLAEVANSSLVKSLLSPDVTLHGKQVLSFGIKLHLVACADGRCASAPKTTCGDRIVDGDETDVDCGGTCGVCRGEAHCAAPSDCETGSCIAGTCAAPTCSDGLRDALETDVDCGGTCGPCAVGESCFYDHDCQSGRCGEPCSGSLCFPAVSTCR